MKSVVVALVLLAACNRHVAEDAADGAQVFATVCAGCHGATGKPNSVNAAHGVKDLTDPVERAKLTPDFIEHQVRFGSQNKLMPALGPALSDAQIKAVAKLVASPQFATP